MNRKAHAPTEAWRWTDASRKRKGKKMKAKNIKKEFEKQLKYIEKKLIKILPEDGISAMIKFYQEERIDKCNFEDDADMLLFQWGKYDFRGKPEYSLNITRQIIQQDEDEPYQLQLTFYFNEMQESINSGSIWCSNLEEKDDFINKINSNIAYQHYSNKFANDVVIEYEQC